MMEIMAFHNPFNVGVLQQDLHSDSFEDAIDRITFPLDESIEQSIALLDAEEEADMKEVFMNAYADDDKDEPSSTTAQLGNNNSEIIIPQKYDIICGRDKLSHAHMGNKRFRVVIEMNRERYQTATSRDDKTRITGEIVAMIRSCSPGGRFLKQVDNNNDGEQQQWMDVGDDYAREKVSHALRSAKDPARKKTRKRRRKSITKSHSEEENKTFFELLQDQQRIFQQLVSDQQASSEPNNKRLRRQESMSSEGSF